MVDVENLVGYLLHLLISRVIGKPDVRSLSLFPARWQFTHVGITRTESLRHMFWRSISTNRRLSACQRSRTSDTLSRTKPVRSGVLISGTKERHHDHLSSLTNVVCFLKRKNRKQNLIWLQRGFIFTRWKLSVVFFFWSNQFHNIIPLKQPKPGKYTKHRSKGAGLFSGRD